MILTSCQFVRKLVLVRRWMLFGQDIVFDVNSQCFCKSKSAIIYNDMRHKLYIIISFPKLRNKCTLSMGFIPHRLNSLSFVLIDKGVCLIQHKTMIANRAKQATTKHMTTIAIAVLSLSSKRYDICAFKQLSVLCQAFDRIVVISI